MVSFGSGPPLVLIPGLNGRWEWMLPAVRALARDFRVITFSLSGERDTRQRIDTLSAFEANLEQVDAALDAAGEPCVTVCGVSYGGWVALRYAATRGDRVSALILASTPPPGFIPNGTQARYLRSPRLLAPAFVFTAPRRMAPELRAALPIWRERMLFSAGHLGRAARTGMSPTRMAARMHAAREVDFGDACRCIGVPTLIITGEPGLDYVVPADQTRRYGDLISGAELATIERTGHLGTITRPRRFAEIVKRFADRTLIRSAFDASRPATASADASAGSASHEQSQQTPRSQQHSRESTGR
jgi:3-oxoadipate enol-lactonase